MSKPASISVMPSYGTGNRTISASGTGTTKTPPKATFTGAAAAVGGSVGMGVFGAVVVGVLGMVL